MLGALFAAVALVLLVATRKQWGEETRTSGALFSPSRHARSSACRARGRFCRGSK